VPAELTEILSELNELLEPERFQDYCPNGLQVPGRARVETIATGVSAHVQLFELAVDEHTDLLLVHHGIFWGSAPLSLDSALKRRLEVLFQADMSLVAYHLPLDAHPEFGNNALLARSLAASEIEPFAVHRGETIGFIARFPDEGVTAKELIGRVREVTKREPLMFDFGPPRVKSLAVVSGAGSDFLSEAIAAGADAFLTGEPAERVMSQAYEAGIQFIAAGHYATETFGVRRLGEHLADRFGLRHVFLDVPNPV
jgi:dinuclear metal center YbgI/SA1388 family protein